MADWTCPQCEETIYGIANEFDLRLAKELHRECLFYGGFNTRDGQK